MQTENLLELDQPDLKEQSEKPAKKNKTLFVLFNAIAFLAGLAALIVLVYFYRDTIKTSLANVGWGFAVIIGCNLTRHFFRAGSSVGHTRSHCGSH